MRSVQLGWILLALAMSNGLAAGTEPASRPADTQPSQAMRKLFLGLADPDAAVRNRSRDALLTLRRADLAELRQVAAEFAPLDQGVVADLREIVTHVYLSGEPYDKDPVGFMGIKMPPGVDSDDMQVVIESRMPGFVGYRALRDGDVIVEIEELSLPKPLVRDLFVDAIRQLRPGQLLHLKVLRQGQMIDVPVALDARPADNTGGNPIAYEQEIMELLNRRTGVADTYWKRNFQPLVDEKPSMPENGAHAGG